MITFFEETDQQHPDHYTRMKEMLRQKALEQQAFEQEVEQLYHATVQHKRAGQSPVVRK